MALFSHESRACLHLCTIINKSIQIYTLCAHYNVHNCTLIYTLLKTKTRHIHRGERLQEVVKRSPLTVSDIVKRAGYSRSSYYNLHIRNPQLSYDILEIYGKVLSYDFTDDFPDMVKYVSFTTPRKDITLEQAIRERDQWRDKYIHLLEKYNHLVEEKKK
jgi:transcriptional regulator with XRE-family HTH domain